MIHQLATRLHDLHASGYVHRDLKPANVMWLPRENRWTIIDFGCVAIAGTTASTAFSVAYAAPEVVQAHRMGEKSIQVKEALDVWSFGVMAYELMAGEPAVSFDNGIEQVPVANLPCDGNVPLVLELRNSTLSASAAYTAVAVTGLSFLAASVKSAKTMVCRPWIR